MANIENKETSSRPINKTTETLIKELETMSDTGLHEMFLFFYKLNHAHSNMLDSNKLPCLYLKFFLDHTTDIFVPVVLGSLPLFYFQGA